MTLLPLTLYPDDVLRKKEISEPYDFQHITHTSQGNFTCLAQANTRDLATELSIVKASQRPESDLKGIRAASLNNRSPSRGRNPQRPTSGHPPTPTTRTTLPVVPRSRLHPGTWGGSSTRPASSATSPDIPEPSSEIIDALLGMHSTTEPVRSNFYAQQMENDRARDLPNVDLVGSLNNTSFNETPPCDVPIMTNTSFENFRGFTEHSKEDILKLAVDDAVDPRHIETYEAPPATAPGVPTGPFSKMNDAHRDIHLEFSDPKWGSAAGSPVLNAFNDETEYFPPFGSIEKVLDSYQPVSLESVDPGIGVAISTDDAGWKWEDDIDLVYESPGNVNATFNWWQTSLDAMSRSRNNDRETFLSSSVSSVGDDDTTGHSTAPTSVIESANTTYISKDGSNASDSILKTSDSFDALYEQSTLAPKRLSLTASSRSKSQDHLNTSERKPNPRRHQSSVSAFNSMPDLVQNRTTRTNSDGSQKTTDVAKMTSSQKFTLKKEAALQRERILSAQPSPPPPMALPPIPTNARQSQKALTIQCNLDKKFPSLAETHPGEETPPLVPPALTHRKTISGAPVKNVNRRRGSSVNRHAANASINGPPKRRMSYSIFPTRDKNPPCAVPSMPSNIPSHKPTAA